MSLHYTDQELLDALKKNPEPAWWYFMMNRYNKLLVFAKKKFKDYPDWKDHADFAINDAILILKDRIADFNSLPQLEDYLFQTIHSKCINQLKVIYKRLGKEVSSAELELMGNQIQDDITEAEVLSSLLALIHKAQIKGRNLTILELRLEGHETDEIAIQLHLKPHQVRKSITRSLKKIRAVVNSENIKLVLLILLLSTI